MRRYIVVSGIPASGKSTIGVLIASGTNLKFLDKDAILEDLFEKEGIGDSQWRSRLSRKADDILREQARQCERAVLVSWWRHPLSTRITGTSTDWLFKLDGDLIEVYCECEPAEAARRFESRQRHQGHLDEDKHYRELLESFTEYAQLGPLGCGRLIRVDTNKNLDEIKLIKEISSTFNEI